MTVRRTCLVAIAVAFATLAAAAPASAQRLDLGITDHGTASLSTVYASADTSSSGGGPTSIELVILRDGAEFRRWDASGTGFAAISEPFASQPGDRFELHSPSGSSPASATYVHQATMTPPCIGATTATGTSAAILESGPTDWPKLVPRDGSAPVDGTVVRSADSYTATFPRAIAADDFVEMDTHSSRADSSFIARSWVIRTPVTCGGEPPPSGGPPPADAPPPAGDQTAPPPDPVTGEKVNVEAVSGTVTVRLPDGRRVSLEEAQQIPTGSVIDARKGAVRLTTTAPGGGTQSAVFSGGMFKVTQSRGKRPVTTLRLVERLAPCPKGKRGARAAGKKAKKRRLWGDGKGSFRTRGRRSAATVTGTKWLVQDSCAGTLTRVKRGKVRVRDFGRRRTITLRAGQKYLAR